MMVESDKVLGYTKEDDTMHRLLYDSCRIDRVKKCFVVRLEQIDTLFSCLYELPIKFNDLQDLSNLDDPASLLLYDARAWAKGKTSAAYKCQAFIHIKALVERLEEAGIFLVYEHDYEGR